MDLTPSQSEILNAVINLFQKEDDAVKGEKVAESINRNPGTIRNQMQSLKALGLIEGVPGPKGGYKPTSKAYQALDYTTFDEGERVEIYREGEKIEGATATEIDLTTLPQPDACKASVRILGEIRVLEEGDEIEIGPTPVNKMLIKGTVVGRDDLENNIILKIKEIHSLPRIPVKDIASKEIIYLSYDDTIKEAAGIMFDKHIKGAPVKKDTEIIGIVTLTDIAGAIYKGDLDIKVNEVMTPEPYSINSQALLAEAMSMLKSKDISRLIVEKDGKPFAMVTKTDILKRLCPI